MISMMCSAVGLRALRPRIMTCMVIGLLSLALPAHTAPLADETEAPTSSHTVSEIIDVYVRDGLGSNLALQSANLEVERSQAALDAARARFFPEASLLARYTRAEGGREIALPLAAAFNPVYGTLNELLVASGQAPRFGMIEDPRFLLQREREQDTRLTVRQAIFAPAIPAAVRARKAALAASDFARLSLAQRLRRDITVGYLDWLQADRATRILIASQELLNENLRVTRSLFDNGVITRDQVFRAEAEALSLAQQRIELEGGARQLRAYVNFLMNRPLDSSLRIADVGDEWSRTERDLEALRVTALTQRSELGELKSAGEIAKAERDIARAERLPSLAIALDGGTQGEAYEFGRGRNFATLSLLLNWTLFDGGARRANERATTLTVRQFEIRTEELRKSIQLEVQQALDALLASQAAARTAVARQQAAQEGFKIATRKRDAGVISQVEFLDARTALTAAELELNRLRFSVMSKQAELDYVTGTPDSPLL
jgi:outer membrane protein